MAILKQVGARLRGGKTASYTTSQWVFKKGSAARVCAVISTMVLPRSITPPSLSGAPDDPSRAISGEAAAGSSPLGGEDQRRTPTPRPGVLDIEPYVGGKSKTAFDGPIHKLSSNESALGASPKAVSAFQSAAETLALYPDGGVSALRRKIADVHGLDPDLVICGAGSDEILQLLCRAYLTDGDNIVQSAHGFLVYALAAKACGAQVHFAPETDLTADVDALLAVVDARTRLVFVANPNNPTGTWLPASKIARLRAGLRPDIILVIDAAYAEYMDDEAYDAGADLVSAHNNVIMTRTFSKIYGLGALRLGWGYGPPAIIDALNRIRGPFNVSAAAQLAGEAAMADQDFVRQNREHNASERAIMFQRLQGIGSQETRLSVVPSAGNFLLVKFPDTEGKRAHDVLEWLMDRGVIVRAMDAYGLGDYLRISIGSSAANRRLLDLLTERFCDEMSP
ncbi:MAG: histidinol-phosphate transaminase [Pseudomonadota bacterium]